MKKITEYDDKTNNQTNNQKTVVDNENPPIKDISIFSPFRPHLIEKIGQKIKKK